MLILFDIDDTLMAHSAAMRSAVAFVHRSLAGQSHLDAFLDSWVRSHERHYPRFLAGLASYTQVSRSRVRDVVAADLADAEADGLFASYLASYESHWTLFPDVVPCLTSLKQHHQLGVISNGPKLEQRRKLEVLGIAQHFAGVYVSEECGVAKPDPGIFLHACSALGCPPEASLYVGDSHDVDAEAARRAGMLAVWLNRASVVNSGQAGPVIGSLAELASLVDALPNPELQPTPQSRRG